MALRQEMRAVYNEMILKLINKQDSKARVWMRRLYEALEADRIVELDSDPEFKDFYLERLTRFLKIQR